MKNTQERLPPEQSLAMLTALVESTDYAIVSETTDNIALSWTPAAEQIYGYTAAEMIGCSMDRLVPLELRSELKEVTRRVLSGAGSQGYETRRLRKDGSEIHVHISKTPIHDELGRAVALSTISHDITERKRAQAAEAARVAELARSNAELEQFAYVASHDLQEPLRMVASYVQLIQQRYQGKLDADADDFINYAVDGAVRMKQLINDLLLYSRAARDVKHVPVDMAQVVAGAMSVLQLAIADAGANIACDAMPTVIGDRSQLGLVIQNLLANAVKFHDGRPPLVHVGCNRRGADWLFSVRDNGIGIEPQYGERIFAIFQRLHGREKYPGTGIGLAICKRVVECHGGKIWVESAPEAGSTFFFTLPASIDERASKEEASGAVS